MYGAENAIIRLQQEMGNIVKEIILMLTAVTQEIAQVSLLNF